MTAALVIMNIVFIILCYATAVKSGFAMNILDFVQNSILYVLPNILMICCVYAVTALLFKNPLPAVPALVLYIIYSNMLTWDSKGQCHARPFSIMVRFPGNFFVNGIATSGISQSTASCGSIHTAHVYSGVDVEKEGEYIEERSKNNVCHIIKLHIQSLLL